jgi:4a-hydroxytetrahydrobiopterin dehydratase
MAELADKTCIPCRGGVPSLTADEIEPLARQLPDWDVVDLHHLDRTYKFKDFREALEFTNRIGELAEEQGHHPDIYLAWGKVGIQLWTHKIDGLSESDFVMAAKIERLSEAS